MKAGTTSLHAYLRSHPQIFIPQKGSEFFARETVWLRGEDWYLNLFAAAQSESVIGEKSTVYSKIPLFLSVPERIAKFNPEARFIYIMRDPVERTISQYWFHMQFCGERREMLTAIREDPQYTDTSNYAMQLAPYVELFGSDRIATLTLEELSKDKTNIMRQLFTWLGVNASFAPPNLKQRENITPDKIVLFKNRRLNCVVRSPIIRALKARMPSQVISLANRILGRHEYLDRSSVSLDKVIEFLEPIQKEQVARLEEMLGRSFPEWTTLYGNLTPAGPTNTA